MHLDKKCDSVFMKNNINTEYCISKQLTACNEIKYTYDSGDIVEILKLNNHPNYQMYIGKKIIFIEDYNNLDDGLVDISSVEESYAGDYKTHDNNYNLCKGSGKIHLHELSKILKKENIEFIFLNPVLPSTKENYNIDNSLIRLYKKYGFELLLNAGYNQGQSRSSAALMGGNINNIIINTKYNI